MNTYELIVKRKAEELLGYLSDEGGISPRLEELPVQVLALLRNRINELIK